MKRVMVIGGPGAGKSTFAHMLGQALGVPAVHMDRLFWEPGWTESEPETFLNRVRAEIAKDAWVMDGNYSRTWPERLARADTVVFLDIPTWLRLWRVIGRTLKGYGTTRFDLADDCPERIDWDFLVNWVGRYRWRARRKALNMMANDGPAGHCERHRLTSPNQVSRFLADVGGGEK